MAHRQPPGPPAAVAHGGGAAVGETLPGQETGVPAAVGGAAEQQRLASEGVSAPRQR